MKKLTLALTALAMVLTLAQCKKNEPEGDKIVPITLNVQAKSDGSRINVDPNTGAVGFEQNDVVYVGSGGKYVGTLTCRGTKFMGNLTNPVEGEPLYFYFLGNKFIYEDDFTPGVSTTASVDVIDQSDPDNLPVISAAVSDQDFTGEGTYTAFFRNKAALMMFNVETSSSDATVIEYQGLKNFVTVNFANNTFTFTDSNDQIVLPPGSGERWAIMLPQSAHPAGTAFSLYSTYDGTCGALPAIVANGYYFEGIPVTVTHWTGVGVIDPPTPPTNVRSRVEGSNVLVEWNNNYAASYYKIYRSSTENGEYTLLGQTSGIAYRDNNPGADNYYKLTCGNDGGESGYSDVTYCQFTAPAAPAVPTNITATVSGSTVVLTWNSVEGAESYLVYRSATADGTFYVIGGSNNNSFTDNGPGSENYYRLTAVNSIGQSAQSDIVYCAFSGSAPATPTNVTSIISNYYNAATISWNSSEGATSYKIYKSTTKNGSYGLIGTTTQTSFTENDLQTDNFYKVSAANTWGESEKSDWTYSYYTATPSPTGAINGKFSVSANDQVYFSQGNLMYRATTNVWRFQNEQWGYCSTDNENISSSYDGWIDLFGWGTSGWNNGNWYYRPFNAECPDNYWDIGYHYGPTDGTNYDYDLTGTYANADWGVFNAIQNGGNQAGLWRTLTYEEFNYVLNGRGTTSGIRYAKAYLPFAYGCEGILLFPDDWPELVEVNNTNNPSASYTTNTISSDTWALMQSRGVVFLPAAGARQNNSWEDEYAVIYENPAVGYGVYWTATAEETHAHYLYFGENGIGIYSNYRFMGFSVRLVREVR